MAVRKIKNRWYVDFRVEYIRYRKPSPENTKAGAEAYETTLRQKLARGEQIDRLVDVSKQNYTFEQFAWKWFEDYVMSNNKFSEQRAKKGVLTLHLIPFFGRLSPGEITTHHVEQFKAQQIKSGVSPKTLRNRLTILSRYLSCAHEWLNLDTHLPKIAWPKCPPVRTDYLSPDECELLLASAEGITYEMILTTLRTGVRQGELKGLQWQSIDWQNRSIVIRHSHCDVRKVLDTPKSNRARHIPLDTDVLTILHRRKKSGGYVFVDESLKPFYSKQLNYRLAEVCKKAGMRKITWHILRHTFASNAAMRGVPLQIVQQLLGHSTVKTTERYAHVAPSMLRTAIDMLNPKTQLNQTFGQPVGNQWNELQVKEINKPVVQP